MSEGWRLFHLFSPMMLARGTVSGANFAALSPAMSELTGVYVKNRSVVAPNPLALDAVLADRVWTATQALIAATGNA